MGRFLKTLSWVGSARKDLRALPEDVKDVFGAALLDAQYGDYPVGARPFGEGAPRDVTKVAEDQAGDTYRLAYVAFAYAVYVLHVFQKKSKSGRSTPRHDIARIVARLKSAREDYSSRAARGEFPR